MAKVAIVGSETLLGREILEILTDRPLAEVVNPDQAEVVFIAGTDATTDVALRPAPGATLIHVARLEKRGVLRAPMAEPEHYLTPESKQIRIAHPAAILLILLFRRLAAVAPIRQAVITLFEPASQQGQAAIEELQEQTIALLNLRPLPKSVYDEQVAFNLLPRWGVEAPESLDEQQQRLEEDLTALYGETPWLSLRLVQAPVFHGYTASAWVSFEADVTVEALARPFREVRTEDEGPATNSGIAGESGLVLDRIIADGPRAAWFWVASDNLRLVAENALLAAASVIEQSTRRVQ